jgi:hypothetical protein
MPRIVAKRACQFCHRPIDSRGHRVHELTCKDRPVAEENHNGDNLKVLMDYYREGLRDGFTFAKDRQKAA